MDRENCLLLEGRTVFIYKGGGRNDPKNNRPISGVFKKWCRFAKYMARAFRYCEPTHDAWDHHDGIGDDDKDVRRGHDMVSGVLSGVQAGNDTTRTTTRVGPMTVKACLGGQDDCVLWSPMGSRRHRSRYGNGDEWRCRNPRPSVILCRPGKRMSLGIQTVLMERTDKTTLVSLQQDFSSSRRCFNETNTLLLHQIRTG